MEHIGGDLLGPSQRITLLKAMVGLPHELTKGCVAWEFRLAEDASPDADISFRFSTVDNTKDDLLDLGVLNEGPTEARAMHDYLTKHRRDKNGLWSVMDNVWVEYDQGQHHFSAVYFGLVCPENQMRICLDRCCKQFSSVSSHSDTSKLLVQKLGSLTRLQIGLMNGRPDQPIRACPVFKNGSSIRPYLESLDLKFCLREIDDYISDFQKKGCSFILQLDFTDRVLPRIGLEIHFNYPEPSFMDRANYVLERLTTEGLCSDTKRSALTRFPGVSLVLPDRTPPFFEQSAASIGYNPVCLERGLGYVKIVFEPEHQAVAKAYVASFYRKVQ